MNARLNAPVFQGSTLTNRALSREVQAAQQEKYGPALSQARSNLGSAQQFQSRVGDWYDQYRNALATAQQQIRNSGVQGQQDIQGLLGAANNGFAQDQAGLNESPALAQQAQQGQAIRAMLTGSFGAMMANSANAANNRAATQTNVVAPTAKFNAQQATQGTITKAQQALTDLLGQEGAFGQQYRGQRLTDEQKNALAAQALGVNQEKVGLAAQALNVNARDKSQKRIIARQKIKVAQNSPAAQKTAQEVQYFNKHGFYPPTGAPKTAKNGTAKAPRTGLGSLTQSQENGFYKQIDQARAIVREYEGKLTPQQIRAGMAQGYLTDAKGKKLSLPKLDPAAISAALDLEGTGHALSQATVKALHNRGIHVGGRYAVAKPPKPLPAPVVSIGPATAAPALGPLPPTQ